MKQKEEFKILKGLSRYAISDLGRIIDLVEGNSVPMYSTGLNYLVVYLQTDYGNKKQYRVHRLVCTAFHKNPENKPEVDHINRIRTDNRATNLRWATRSENMLNRDMCKKINMLNKDGLILRTFENTKSAAEYIKELENKDDIYPIQVAICQVCSHKRPTAYKFKWEYVKENPDD